MSVTRMAAARESGGRERWRGHHGDLLRFCRSESEQSRRGSRSLAC